MVSRPFFSLQYMPRRVTLSCHKNHFHFILLGSEMLTTVISYHNKTPHAAMMILLRHLHPQSRSAGHPPARADFLSLAAVTCPRA